MGLLDDAADGLMFGQIVRTYSPPPGQRVRCDRDGATPQFASAGQGSPTSRGENGMGDDRRRKGTSARRLEHEMRLELVAIAVFVCSAPAGCGATQSTPGCGNEETLDLVKEIILRESEAKGLDIPLESLALEFVTTTSYDKELDTYFCSATVEVEFATTNAKLSEPITFSVQPLATDPTQFVVQVYRL